MLAERTAVLEFEQVRQDYEVEDARGIPMSVHDRYRKALAEMRCQIREARNGARGKKLGELLVEQGVLDQEKLDQRQLFFPVNDNYSSRFPIVAQTRLKV